MISGAAQQDKKVWQPLSLGHNRYVAFSQFRSKALPRTSLYGARERGPGNEQSERESTENEVRVLSAVFGVLEKMTKMAQNVYTFYEEVKKKNQPNYCPRLVADYKRESENMVI